MNESRLTPLVEASEAPTDRPSEVLDVRDLPPPEPLATTLERRERMPTDAVLLQVNDRAPQHLYPKLRDRGYVHDTVEGEGFVLTAIWTP